MTPPIRLGPHLPGFTLVEILIVVMILGILAAIVIPQFTSAGEDARKSTFMENMHTYAVAAEAYRAKTGQYLEDSNSGDAPAGWADYVDADQWEAGTPIGGVWDFELDSHGIKSGFGVHFHNCPAQPDAYMLDIDRQMDDGDLCTGRFRKIAAGRFYYILADE